MGWLDSPCEQYDLPPTEQVSQNEYCGYRQVFTKHDWCQRHYIGLMLEDGTIEGCYCPCHKRTQGVLFP